MLKSLSSLVVLLLSGIAGAWLVARGWLARADEYAVHDHPPPPLEKQPDEISDGHLEVVARLRSAQSGLRGAGLGERRTRVRAWFDSMGRLVEHDCTIVPVEDGDVRGEWVVPPGGDADRRVLYLHGGAFEAGSPLSHRSMTTGLAQRTGAAVFALDYRLAPEHPRRAALDDCDAGWAYVLATGPVGPAPARELVVAGDSAGANLTLSLVLRVRDGGGRQPDAVLAFAPLTDSTLSSPTWRTNADTDAFLGPRFAPIVELPRELLALATWALTRIRPTDPAISPLFGDLSDLPPTLLQASSDEMLAGDSIRFSRAARAAGSPVELQLWPVLVHVWQAFGELPEADEALDRAVAFVERQRRRGTTTDPGAGHGPAEEAVA